MVNDQVFRPASRELTDGEIRQRYGSLIQRAVSAFGSDPSYLVDMAEHASLIEYKRQLWKARSLATERLNGSASSEPGVVRDMALAILGEWGVYPPSRLSRGSRRKKST